MYAGHINERVARHRWLAQWILLYARVFLFVYSWAIVAQFSCQFSRQSGAVGSVPCPQLLSASQHDGIRVKCNFVFKFSNKKWLLELLELLSCKISKSISNSITMAITENVAVVNSVNGCYRTTANDWFYAGNGSIAKRLHIILQCCERRLRKRVNYICVRKFVCESVTQSGYAIARLSQRKLKRTLSDDALIEF